MTDARAITNCLRAHDVGFDGLTPTGIENADPRAISLAVKINAILTHVSFREIDQGNPSVDNTEKSPEI